MKETDTNAIGERMPGEAFHFFAKSKENPWLSYNFEIYCKTQQEADEALKYLLKNKRTPPNSKLEDCNGWDVEYSEISGKIGDWFNDGPQMDE